jgi:putative ABC transport system permease protein
MLYYTLRNAVRNRRRALLTIAVFAVATGLLGFLGEIYRAMFLRAAPPEQALRLIVRNRSSFLTPLPESYGHAIEKIEGVRAVAPLGWFGGKYKDESDPTNFFAQYATDPAKLLRARLDIVLAPEAVQRFISNRTACIIGAPLAKRLNLHEGDHVSLRSDFATLELTVAGVYDAPVDNENLYFNREYEQQSYPSWMRGEVGLFLVGVNTGADTTTVPQSIDSMFRNSTASTRTETEQTFLLSFVEFIGNIKVFLGLVCTAFAILMLAASANACFLSVRERTSELGVLRAIGYRKDAIIRIVVGESALLAVVGTAIGCGLATLLCMGIRQGPMLPPQLKNLQLEPTTSILCLVLALTLATMSSIGPVAAVARAPIVSALRNLD